MHHVRQLLSAALLSAVTATGCGLDAEDFDLDIQYTPSDPFDNGSHTVGELGQARFQMGSCAPLLLGPCDLVTPIMAGHQTTMLVDVPEDDGITYVESSNPEVLVATPVELTDHGHRRLALDARVPGATTLMLRRDDGSLLDHVQLEVRAATNIRWTIALGEAPEPTEHEGDGQLALSAGEQLYLVARPIDGTGRIVNGFGAMNALLVNGTEAVAQTGNEGGYVVGLEGLGAGQAKLHLSTGEALIEVVVTVAE